MPRERGSRHRIMAPMDQAVIAGSSDQSRIWLAKAPLTAQQDLSLLFRLGRTLRDIPTWGRTRQHPPLPPLPQAVIPAPPPAADTRGLVGAMERGGGVSCRSPALPSPCQPGQRCVTCTLVPLTLPSLARAAYHQWRCLHWLHISEVTRSVQCPAVVPLIECGIVVWSRRGDSQSRHLHGGSIIPIGDASSAPSQQDAPPYSPSPTWSHVAHLDLLPGGFLVYKHRRTADQTQPPQPRAAEEPLPAPARGAQTQLQHC